MTARCSRPRPAIDRMVTARASLPAAGAGCRLVPPRLSCLRAPALGLRPVVGGGAHLIDRDQTVPVQLPGQLVQLGYPLRMRFERRDLVLLLGAEQPLGLQPTARPLVGGLHIVKTPLRPQ